MNPDQYADLIDRLAELKAKLNHVDESTQRLEQMMTGGEEPDRGFLLRLDRIEREQGFARWLVGGSFLIFLAAMVGWYFK